ncbi:DUF4129 domain-containing protein [Haloarchaeobius sp. TZWWS8]|uniref:DUF4129 domain-containing protein n=1 Tax=Haloarchaeobius sp. TZWWS8 TaxID=3446121 RepID=UPI003EB9E23F
MGVVLVAVCCLLAIAVAAGTLSQTTNPGSNSGPAAGPHPAETTRTTTQSQVGPTGTTATPVPPVKQECDTGSTWWAVFGGVGLVVGVTVGMYRRYDGVVAVMSLIALATVLLAIAPVMFQCDISFDDPPEPREGEPFAVPNSSPEAGGGDQQGDGGTSPLSFSTPLLLLLGAIGILAVVTVGAWLVTADEVEQLDREDPDAEVADQPTESADVQALSVAAGEAADRIRNETDADNEIYRAWVALTQHLPVEHPETSTPREFERAALDAGFDPEPVSELTELFEQVRYGHDEPTPDRERRAVEALRRLEAHDWGENR